MKRISLILLSSFILHSAFCQEHITLIYNGVNEILNSKYFYDEVRKVPRFDNTKLSGQKIADKMEKANQDIRIVRKIKPIANASTKTSDKIKISHSLFGKDSTTNFSLSIAVNTLIHETVHAVDFLNSGNEFTHDENSPEGQENTAPWVIGAIAEKMVEENKL